MNHKVEVKDLLLNTATKKYKIAIRVHTMKIFLSMLYLVSISVRVQAAMGEIARQILNTEKHQVGSRLGQGAFFYLDLKIMLISRSKDHLSSTFIAKNRGKEFLPSFFP